VVESLVILCSILAILLVLLGLFAYNNFVHGMPETEALKRKGSSKLIALWMMEFAYWILHPLVRGLVWFRIHPNTISWASVFFAGFGAIALTKGFFGYGAGLFGIAFGLDAVDGMVARMANMESDAGAILDSTLDRYTEFFFFFGLMFYYRFEALALGLVATALCGSWMVSYSSAKAEALNVKIPRGTMRRPERLLILTLGAAFAPLITPITEGEALSFPFHFSVLVSVGFVAVFSNCTAIYRVYWIYRILAHRANIDVISTFPFHRKTKFQRVSWATLASSIPTVLDVAALVLLVEFVGFNYLPATMVACLIGTTFSYLIRHAWFYPPGQSPKGREFYQEMFISATNIVWNVMLVYGFTEWLELKYWISRVLAAIAVGVVWNWPLYSRLIFPSSNFEVTPRESGLSDQPAEG